MIRDAKRRRVAHIADQLEQWRMGRHDSEDRDKAVDGLEELLKLEALPMADRPEYREEWKPWMTRP